ncbi:MAG: Coenzyme F420 hydrogenase/dehydrogenase, beta subunit C-terminal domain [Desulfobacteraceae bacterium]|nr:Coenzyme F420 hydrogenase/dehydrogenase, beta subunit C-terminal domain [Desulfobacteraceae bacterium]
MVAAGLCTRCGACAGVCPAGAVRLEAENGYFPRLTAGCTQCGRCLQVCGGREVDFPALAERHYGRRESFRENAIGPLRFSEAAFSRDERVRKNGSSGGLASQILIDLLAAGTIDGAVVVDFTEDTPPRPVPRVARSRQEIVRASQSKYCLFPVAHVYRELIDTPGRYAVVGLPCQLHSLRKWQEASGKLRERVVLAIGLFCHTNLEPGVIGDLLASKGIAPSRVRRLEFRGGAWPGGMRVTLEDGRIVPLHPGDIKDGAFNYLKYLYGAARCRLCPDFSAELADIAISDPWVRGPRGEYLFQGGWSVAHVRTPVGEKFWEEVKKRGQVTTAPVVREAILAGNRSLTRYKKKNLPARLAWRQSRNRPVPEYHLGPLTVGRRALAREQVAALLLRVLHSGPVRRLLLLVLFSRSGIVLIRARAASKKVMFCWGKHA